MVSLVSDGPPPNNWYWAWKRNRRVCRAWCRLAWSDEVDFDQIALGL